MEHKVDYPLDQIPVGNSLVILPAQKSRAVCTGPHSAAETSAHPERSLPGTCERERKRNRATRSQATRGEIGEHPSLISAIKCTTCIVDCDNMLSNSSAISN